MNKKFLGSLSAVVMAGTLVLSGCGNNAGTASKAEETPKALVKASVVKATEITSYQLDSNFTVNTLTVTAPSSADSASVDQVVSMLKGAEFNVKTVYQGDPMQAEMMLEVKLKGDMEMTIKLPMVMTKEKLYVKVPDIALLPLPENLVGKFIEIDMNELAAEQGAEVNTAMMDPKNAQKLSQDVSSAILDSYDEATYFKKLSATEAGLPEGVKAEDIVRFEVTNDNVKEAITTLVNVALPKVIDTLDTPEYREMLGATEEDFAKAREELSTKDNEEMNKQLDELKNYLTVNTFQIDTALNADKFPVYQKMLMDVNFKDDESGTSGQVALQGTSTYSKLNEKQTFEVGIPTDTVTLDELQSTMNGY
ncbi:hypothetical protein QWJ34_25610 [Saccharibacillus sp. CPCC 101409]|uniref:hypothetical protein n=1 Tax=Saccharibacillus sp. CPCC 101409 TaxID=3058041 RepID=UPI002671EB29|nr:hypothetical protein [Saccharibacillus sp. CPCC 101409]MDO3413155.1 hypothetical protein [Saccharibacillus sp. CPCC 101409]